MGSTWNTVEYEPHYYRVPRRTFIRDKQSGFSSTRTFSGNLAGVLLQLEHFQDPLSEIVPPENPGLISLPVPDPVGGAVLNLSDCSNIRFTESLIFFLSIYQKLFLKLNHVAWQNYHNRKTWNSHNEVNWERRDELQSNPVVSAAQRVLLPSSRGLAVRWSHKLGTHPGTCPEVLEKSITSEGSENTVETQPGSSF